MKKLTKLVCAGCVLLSLVACTTSANTETNTDVTQVTNLDNYEVIFEENENEVIDIYIDIDETDLQSMFDNAMEEEYFEANITVDGITVENVGIRTKGASSLSSVASSDSDRYGFKIKTDEYVDDQTLLGLDMFVLNGSFSDPSYMREYLTYVTAADFGLSTPNLVYTNVYFNDELFGFYLCIESYDDAFVERLTDDEDAVLYKADADNCNLTTTDDASGFEVKYGEDEGNINIQNLIEVLNSTTEDNTSDLEEILDIDSVLKNVALNTVMGNYDSYSGSKAHNYYLLYSDGQFEYLAWDYNMSIGGFAEDNGSSVNVDIYEPLFSTDSESRPLIDVLLSIDEYNERYLEYVSELTDYLSDFQTQVDELSAIISTYVENDPTAFYDYESYLSNITASDVDLTQIQSNVMGEKPGMMVDMNTAPTEGTELTEEELANRPDMANEEMANRPEMSEDEMANKPEISEEEMANQPELTEEELANRPDMANEEIANRPEMSDDEIANKPDMANEEIANKPEMSDDEMANKPEGIQNMGQSNQISRDTVSIIDYITQRLSVISEQMQ